MAEKVAEALGDEWTQSPDARRVRINYVVHGLPPTPAEASAIATALGRKVTEVFPDLAGAAA